MQPADSAWLGLHPLDWFVLIGYFVVVVGIGVWMYRRVRNMADFFMGGRRFGKLSMMFFAFGAGTSSDQAISVVAGTWRAGLAGIWWQFLWLWATPFYWIIAPVMRRMRALTTADFFEARYNASTAALYSVYGIIMSIVFIAGGLYGSGKMVNALTGGELDRLAERVDIQVPQIQWDPEYKRFGRGVLFDAPPEFREDLDRGVLPEELHTQMVRAGKVVSDDLRVERLASGERWVIADAGRGVSYPVSVFGDGDDQRLRIRGSGWRLLEGYEFAILAMTAMFVIYGMAGGLGAAIVTDLIQGVLTIIFSFLLLPFIFGMLGGFGRLHAEGELKPGMFDLVASARVAEALGEEPITVFYVFMLSLTALAGIVVQPHIMGVCGAGKTEMEGRVGFTFGNFLKRFCTIAWTFTGLAAIVWYLGSNSPLMHLDVPHDPASAEFLLLPEETQQRLRGEFAALSPEEQQAIRAAYRELPDTSRRKIDAERRTYLVLRERASPEFAQLSEAERRPLDQLDRDFADSLFGRAAYDILPGIAPGLVGLLLASLLAAVMSTGDAQMVVSSGLFTENLYKRFLVRNRTQQHYLWTGRIAGLVIVLFALVLQSTFADVIDALRVIIKTPAAIGISLWIGIVWRGWTSAAVWFSTLTAAATWAFVAYYPDAILQTLPFLGFMFTPGGKMADAWQMALYLSAGVVSGMVVSLVTPRPSPEKLDHFFALLHTPVTPGEAIEAPCTLPNNPAPRTEKLFAAKDIEIARPTLVGLGGFALAWVCVGLLIWLTYFLVRVL